MESAWKMQDTLAILRSKWITVFAEHWRDSSGALLEYWRVERCDSVIVLPFHRNRFLCPEEMFRPGIGRCTLDFPGGRLPVNLEPRSTALGILERELGIAPHYVRSLKSINEYGFIVDSAFSSQKVWGFIADLDPLTMNISPKPFRSFPCTEEGLKELLNLLECLQCRALLLESINKKLFELAY